MPCETSPCQACCTSLCQHPECWRSSLQQVREAVWRRNGLRSQSPSQDSSAKMGEIYLRREQRVQVNDGGLPTLNIVDMFGDMDSEIKNSPTRKHDETSSKCRSASLPSLHSTAISQASLPKPLKSPRPSPSLSSPPLTEYQRRMQWKKQFVGPSRVETASTRETSNSVKVSTIGVHEVYEQDELDQNWEEVYVTSAYLVWCPSNKKRRKKRASSSQRSSASSSRHHSKTIIPKDVTEDLIPVSMETPKLCSPKSTKTPTGGQPFPPHSPSHKSPAHLNPELRHYGMEDLSSLPKPVLSGILNRLNLRNIEATPVENKSEDTCMISSPIKDTAKPPDQLKELMDAGDVLPIEEGGSKVHLAVDINSRFTTPEEDEHIEEQKHIESAADKLEDTKETSQLALILKEDNKVSDGRTKRELLPMHYIGVPVEELPQPTHHHCTNSIPKRLSLGVAMEPVNLVPVTPSPSSASSEHAESPRGEIVPAEPKTEPLVVNVPSGRPESAPVAMIYDNRYYINNAFRYTPSPVRAPAPTPISPDKYSEYARYSRASKSRRKSSSQEEDPSKPFRRWDTLGNLYDADESAFEEGVSQARGSPVGEDIISSAINKQIPAERVFLTEGIELPNEGVWPSMGQPTSTPRCRSTSPGSKTYIPRDIMDQFQGDLYGKRYHRAASSLSHTEQNAKNKSVVLGGSIVAPGWRPPRSRTPIQFSETPSRFPPRPLKQPPKESIPKSLQIVSIPKPQRLQRPKSTPPRMSTPNDNDPIPLVLSESSLVNNSADTAVSMEVRGSNVTDSGSVPPPPSPEVPVSLRNELHPILDTLCEEDERSSRTTSIADMLDKGFTSSRLSPLGGGSEISEDSVALPVGLDELHEDVLQHDRTENHDQAKPPLAQPSETTQETRMANTEASHEENTLDSEELCIDNISQEERVNKNTNQVTTEVTQELPDNPDEPTISSIPETHDSQKAGISIGEDDEQDVFRGSPELHSPRAGSVEPEPILQPSGSPEPIAQPPGSPEPIVQPPGSPEPEPDPPQPPGTPDATSTKDFTEGVDMELDLAAELQAAMEGLDDFDLDDDNQDFNDADDYSNDLNLNDEKNDFNGVDDALNIGSNDLNDALKLDDDDDDDDDVMVDDRHHDMTIANETV